MEIIIDGKKFSTDVYGDLSDATKLAVEIAKADFSYAILSTLEMAVNYSIASKCLEKKVSDKDAERICALAKHCYLKDCTEVGEIRFYDSIITLINKGYSIDELENKYDTWELITLCEIEGNLRSC